MSDRDMARRTDVEISFDNVNISKSIRPYLLSVSYTDNEEDETDDLQIKLQDRDSIWMEKWLEKAIDAAAAKKPGGVGAASTASGKLPAGTKLALKNVKGYVDSYTSASFGTVTGTYYTWDDEVLRNRVRITNQKSRVGKANQITCWIGYSDAVEASGGTVSGGTASAPVSSGDPSGKIEAGTKLALNATKGYVDSYTSSSFGTKTGTYYAWDGKIMRGRIRITNTKENVGKPGKVTCWIAAADANLAGDGNQKAGVSATGMAVRAVMLRRNWKGDGKDKVLDCGQFELDTVAAGGPPSVITIKASSLPFSSQIRQTKKNRAWESYNLSGIAKEMAAANGMACMYSSGKNPQYRRVEQVNTSDIQFLSRLCKDAGISLKVTNNMIVLFDQATYETKPSVITITRGDKSYTKWNLNVGKADKQYTSCRVSYTSPSGTVIEGIARVEDYKEDSKTNQQLEIRAKVSSQAEAKNLAAKRLRLHNKYEKTASFTMPGNPDLVSGVTVKLSKWGAWNGKYIISQATHRVDGSGFVTQIKLRRVLEGY